MKKIAMYENITIPKDIKNELKMFVYIGGNQQIRQVILNISESKDIEKIQLLPYLIFRETQFLKDEKLGLWLMQSNNHQIKRLIKFMNKYDISEVNKMREISEK